MPVVVIAPDKFRGTVTAPVVVAAAGRAARANDWVPVGVPMADGGEGTLDAFGGPNRTTTVTGPLGDQVDAAWRLSRRVAVIESARASGLDLVGGADENDAVAASTYGTGELISAALDAGARRIIVGLGGSATTDGGLGALRAMAPLARLRAVDLIVACDVRTTFVAAADVFAPQKGATPAQVEFLRRRLERLAEVYLEEHHVDVRELRGSGAAGGLAGGLAAIGARLADGFELVAEERNLADHIETADLVVTGEGYLDDESFEGKVVGGVVEIATSLGIPVLVVVGGMEDGEQLPIPAGVEVVSLTERFGEDAARSGTAALIEQVVTERLTGPS